MTASTIRGLISAINDTRIIKSGVWWAGVQERVATLDGYERETFFELIKGDVPQERIEWLKSGLKSPLFIRKVTYVRVPDGDRE